MSRSSTWSTDGEALITPEARAEGEGIAGGKERTADACGGYLDVTGPNGSVRVLITNRCPECLVGHLDLSKTAFARIGPLEAGEIDVTYSLVRNPPLDRTLALRVKTGSSRWWMQIQPLDHGNPIASFELQTGGSWRSLVHTQDNPPPDPTLPPCMASACGRSTTFVAENPGPGDGPYTVRITDIYGQSATVDGITMTPDQVQRTTARLYGAGAGSGSAAPAPTTAPPTTVPPTTAAPTTAAPTTSTTSTSTSTSTTAPPSTTAAGDRGLAVAETVATGRSGPGTATVVVLLATVAAIVTATVLLRRRGGESV